MFTVKVISLKKEKEECLPKGDFLLTPTGDTVTYECEEYHVHSSQRNLLMYKNRVDTDQPRYIVGNRTFSKDQHAEVYITNESGRTIDHHRF